MHLKNYLSGIFILLISTQTFSQNTYPLTCNHTAADYTDEKQKEIKIVETATMRDLAQICPELNNYDDPRIKSYKDWDLTILATEATQYARLKRLGCASSANNINKIQNRSNKLSDFLPNVRPSCEAFLLKEWGITGGSNTGSTSNTQKQPQYQSNNSNQSQSNNSSQSQNQPQPSESQQAQQIQQTMKEAQQQAQQNQKRADQAREGKRKTHEPENEAHQCIEVDKNRNLWGGVKNICSFKVSYVYCNYRPQKDAMLSNLANCETSTPSTGSAEPNRSTLEPVNKSETIYYFACKSPSKPIDYEYVPGKGISARCFTW